MTVDVAADDARGAGHALIRVFGAANVADASFRLARPPGWPEPNLGPAGWQGPEATLQPDAVMREGADLVLSVGPAICGAVEEGTYIFTLVAAGTPEPVIWPMIETVHGGDLTFFARAAAPPTVLTGTGPGQGTRTPTPPQPPETPIETAETEQRPRLIDAPGPIQPVPRPRRSLPALIAACALLLLAAGGAWWWTHRPEAPVQQAAVTPPEPPPRPIDVPPPPPPPAQPDPDTMGVADLVDRNDPQLMLQQAQKRLATKPQDSMLLLEAAGEDRHYGPALTQLARLYDPLKPRQGGIPADARQAAKYYRDAERNNDHDGSADREALHRTLLSRKEVGDLNAKLTEQDFWP